MAYKITQLYMHLWQRIYYRKIVVNKQTKIPFGKPVIYAANHRNALIDALAISCTANHQPYFLARADIFKKKFQAKLLRMVKILPVYRIRDGADSLSKNDEVFNSTIDIFKVNASLGIFPEASHSAKFRMRNLKKGVPRVAFIAESKSGFKLDLHVIPVGLNYSEINKSNTELIVQFGEPIRVADYQEAFYENPVKAHNLLRDELQARIQKMILHVDDDKEYDFFNESRWVLRSHYQRKQQLKRTASNNLKADQQIVDALEEAANKKPQQFEGFKQSMSAALATYRKASLMAVDVNLYHEWKQTPFLNILYLLLLIPFALVGTIIFAIPQLFLSAQVKKRVKDICFESTFYFAGGFFLFSIWLALVAIVGSFFIDIPFAGLVIYLGAIAIAWPTIRWYGMLRKFASYRKTKNVVGNETGLFREFDELC